MTSEFGWRVLLLQELTKATKFPLPQTCDGHRIIAGVPNGGSRVPAIVLHESVIDMVIGEPILQNTAVAVLLRHPQLGSIFLVSAHLLTVRKQV